MHFKIAYTQSYIHCCLFWRSFTVITFHILMYNIYVYKCVMCIMMKNREKTQKRRWQCVGRCTRLQVEERHVYVYTTFFCLFLTIKQCMMRHRELTFHWVACQVLRIFTRYMHFCKLITMMFVNLINSQKKSLTIHYSQVLKNI